MNPIASSPTPAIAAGGCISRRLVRPKTAGSWSWRPIASARRPQPEKLVEMAIRRIAHAVRPTPNTQAHVDPVGAVRADPVGEAEHWRRSPSSGRASVVPPAVVVGPSWVGKADAAAVATAA